MSASPEFDTASNGNGYLDYTWLPLITLEQARAMPTSDLAEQQVVAGYLVACHSPYCGMCDRSRPVVEVLAIETCRESRFGLISTCIGCRESFRDPETRDEAIAKAIWLVEQGVPLN